MKPTGLEFYGDSGEKAVLVTIFYTLGLIAYRFRTGGRKPSVVYISPTVKDYNDMGELYADYTDAKLVDTFVKEYENGKPKIGGERTKYHSFIGLYIIKDEEARND